VSIMILCEIFKCGLWWVPDAEFMVDPNDVLIGANQEGQPSGIAYIRFFNARLALEAQQALDGTTVGGRKLRVGILEGPREPDTALSLY
jgi:RNA recognition motif-containing protein